MKINTNENIVEIDVDQTLILRRHQDYPSQPKIQISYYGIPWTVTPHLDQIELLKSYKKRGFYIQVHSNNGWKHAKEVIQKLDLVDFVDEVRTKACKTVDDVKEDTRQHVYIPPPLKG